ncbi:LPXTG cell wall anchor domain-containing protein [Streptomyces sp. URMC 123]|uniref:LPXTG cell wall anchor domain-containing protein n=1 Tax=Streptomyces sp. URMC 123 TaxID=3423403 RepID=UPI003F1A3480
MRVDRICRAGGLALATTVAAAAMLLAAPAAHAETVDVDYRCKTPIGDKGAVSPIEIKGVKSGSSYRLTMSFRKGVSSSPVELGAGAMNPSALITVGGADSGTVTVTGPANSSAIPANTPIRISDLSGTYTPRKSGKVTFTAGVLTIKALGTTTTCTPANSPKPSLTLDVTAAGGSDQGSSGASGSGSPSGSGSAAGPGPGTGAGADQGSAGAGQGGDRLPQTGPMDSAVALGTLGGTILLVGAAGVLWLTRRRRALR